MADDPVKDFVAAMQQVLNLEPADPSDMPEHAEPWHTEQSLERAKARLREHFGCTR